METKKTNFMHYVAGVIDSDGNIQIGESKGSFYTTVRVECTSFRLTKLLWKEFGGSFSHSTRKKHIGGKTTYVWMLSSRMAEDFLHEVQNYLVTKKREAKVALKFRATYNKSDDNWRNKEHRRKLIQKLQSYH